MCSPTSHPPFEVAVKILTKEKILKAGPEAIKMIDYEIEFFTKMRPKLTQEIIINCFGHYEDAKQHYLVLEKCATDLFKFIKENDGSLNEAQSQAIFRQLVFAIQELHEHKQAHRDIKPYNVLLLEDRETIRLIDFGTTKYVKDYTMTKIGSALYKDAKVTEQPHPHGYNPFAADMWSLGCTLHEMLTGDPPFIAQNELDLTKKIKEGAEVSGLEFFQNDCSPCIFDLFTSLMRTEPNCRPKIDEVAAHAFVACTPKQYKDYLKEDKKMKKEVKKLDNKIEAKKGLLQELISDREAAEEKCNC